MISKSIRSYKNQSARAIRRVASASASSLGSVRKWFDDWHTLRSLRRGCGRKRLFLARNHAAREDVFPFLLPPSPCAASYAWRCESWRSALQVVLVLRLALTHAMTRAKQTPHRLPCELGMQRWMGRGRFTAWAHPNQTKNQRHTHPVRK